MTTTTWVSQLWDMIETCSFFEDIKDTKDINENDNNKDNNKDNNNDKDNNNNRGISALEHDRDLGFLGGHQGHQQQREQLQQ